MVGEKKLQLMPLDNLKNVTWDTFVVGVHLLV